MFFSCHFLLIPRIKSAIILNLATSITLGLSYLCKIILVYYHGSVFFFHATSVIVLESSSFFISARKKISVVNYPHGLYLDFAIFSQVLNHSTRKRTMDKTLFEIFFLN